MVQEVIFGVLAALVVGSALGVITARNPVHAVLFLVLAFVGSAGLWILMEAEFLGIVLVLVYVGAVMVLFLFVVMMLDIHVATLRSGMARYAPIGILVALVMLGEIGYVVWSRKLGVTFGTPLEHGADYSNTRELGDLIYTSYAFPFEIAAVILLVGIVAAIALTLRRRENTRSQDPGKQVQATPAGRVRLVRMSSDSNKRQGK
ncbi:MAG TPA: NADH-quinone oxidoreductase subunit J [Gammaproteobacteria bacterium]|nr:NADH-quinone oxidoreductase subunit J [Gammaproteobacteria bacterium]